VDRKALINSRYIVAAVLAFRDPELLDRKPAGRNERVCHRRHRPAGDGPSLQGVDDPARRRRSRLQQRPTEDRFLLSRGDLENRLAVLLGGRAAEMLVLNEASTGAADDLNKATDIARDMVARVGMHDKLGLVTYETPRQTFLGENAFALRGTRVSRGHGARSTARGGS
jgi:hypothetical protein